MKQLFICSQNKDFIGEVKSVHACEIKTNFFKVYAELADYKVDLGFYSKDQSQAVIEQIANQLYNHNEGFVLYFMPKRTDEHYATII